jgi:hypothetical protein
MRRKHHVHRGGANIDPWCDVAIKLDLSCGRQGAIRAYDNQRRRSSQHARAESPHSPYEGSVLYDQEPVDPAVRTPRGPSGRRQDVQEILVIDRRVHELPHHAPAGHNLQEICSLHRVDQGI